MTIAHVGNRNQQQNPQILITIFGQRKKNPSETSVKESS